MEILEYIYLSFFVSVALFLWNETDFFVEYCKLFGVWDLFKISDYEEYVERFDSATYLDFLSIKYGHYFLVRLITCPICLGVWLNLAVLFINASFSSFVINLWLSLFLYFILKFVMRKSDE